MNHGKAVHSCVSQRHHAVEEAGARNGKADTRFAGQEPPRRSCVAGIRFVPEADIADARRLGQPGQIGDGNPDNSVDGRHVVELESINHQMETVGQ